MTDTNKLAELIKQAKSKMWGKTFTCVLERNMFIADHLLANGVILLPEDLRDTEDFSISAFIEAMQMYKQKDRYIKLPCKVGDVVYTIFEGDIEALKITYTKTEEAEEFVYRFYDAKNKFLSMPFSDRSIGKTVFLTREEAEEKLKEREKV